MVVTKKSIMENNVITSFFIYLTTAIKDNTKPMDRTLDCFNVNNEVRRKTMVFLPSAVLLTCRNIWSFAV